jgi:hypothetical protein
MLIGIVTKNNDVFYLPDYDDAYSYNDHALILNPTVFLDPNIRYFAAKGSIALPFFSIDHVIHESGDERGMFLAELVENGKIGISTLPSIVRDSRVYGNYVYNEDII